LERVKDAYQENGMLYQFYKYLSNKAERGLNKNGKQRHNTNIKVTRKTKRNKIKGLPKEVNLSEEVRKVLELKVKSHNNEGIMCFLCWNENLAPNELSLLKSPLDDEEGHKQFFFLCDECILKNCKTKTRIF